MGQNKTVRAFRKLVCFPIKIYQVVLRPYLPNCCRFYPSCSQYAGDALMRYGLLKGLWQASLRLLRCHPWSQGGYDPVCVERE